MERRLYILISMLLLCIVCRAEYVFHHYSVEDGLSQNTVMCIIEDREGYMWFGTWDGLNKFDGYEFTIYKSNEGKSSLRNSRVEFIAEDKLGYIWFETYDGSFHRLDKSTNEVIDLSYSFPLVRYKSERKFIEPSAGNLFIVSDEALVYLSEQSDGTLKERLYSGSGAEGPHFVVADEEGNIWYDDNGLICRRNYSRNDSTIYTLKESASSFSITTATVTSDGIWFGSNIGKMWRYSLSKNAFEPVLVVSGAEIVDIVPLTASEILVGTVGSGLYLYNNQNGGIAEIASASKIGNIISLNNDGQGVIWVETDRDGIWRYRLSDHSLKHLEQQIDIRYSPLRANMILLEDGDHNVWVNPFGGGLSRYNKERDELENPLVGITNMVHTAYVGKQGELWLSSYDTGIDCVNLNKQPFRLRDMRSGSKSIGEIRAMLELSNGDVLLANKDEKIMVMRGASISELKIRSDKDVLLSVYSLLEEDDGSVLVGTRYDGLYRLRNGRLTSENRAVDGTGINCNAVYDMLRTFNGDLYIGTYGGGVNILRGGRMVNSDNDWTDYPSALYSKVRCLLNVGDTMILAGTTNGLLQIRQSDLKTWVTPYSDVHCLLQDSRGNIWMGSFSGGLSKIVKLADDEGAAQLETYTTTNGLRSDIVLNLIEDESGRLWYSSENNITRFDPQTGDFQHFTPFFNSKEGCFTEAKALKLSYGNILFGYNHGFCTFTPERILRSENIPPLHFTGFQLFNTDVEIGAEGSPLKTAIDYTERIRLSHKMSSWSIEYAAIDMFNADKIEYAFMLDGFEKEWNIVHGQRKATYTNLPAGKYVFRVKSTNADGVWVDNERTIKVEITPSFWLTGWAIMLYILIAFAVLVLVLRVIARYSRLQQQIEIEKQVTDIRLRFFTNISHELRTPLTLIFGPVDNILKTEKLSNSVKTQLEIVQSNAQRMLRLINEILDFRKIQNKKMRLRIQEINIGQLVENVCGNFNKEAYDKHISFRVENEAPEAMLWIDKEKMDTIIYNLLSNAFKFTPAGKSITVKISEKPNFVLIKVLDEGVGIPREKRGVIFERFSSHNEIEKLTAKAGTGIGLNLVKELVDLHKGYIEVESELDKGTAFTVILRTGKEHFGNEVDFVSNADVLPHTLEPLSSKLDNVVVKQNLPKMLIVEDNESMRTFLTNIFIKEFTIETAKDGEEGLSKAKEYMPEIVISDLMMPNMDGLEMTGMIKRDETINHIPIVLLTAKEAVESRVEAMRVGADDYITKPFSAEYLKARVDNILQQRERLRERFRTDLLTLQTSPMAKEKTADEVFLAKLLDFMEKNMDNNELVVEDMVSEMAMGRTVFFNKLKSITGLSPVEFIREVRIKKAAQLLEAGTYNITEITYMVGMNDSRYFSKCFKSVYGVTPTEYKRQKMEEKK